MTDNPIPNGAGVLIKEAERIKREKIQAAKELAEQIVHQYLASASYRTSVVWEFSPNSFEFFEGLARKYFDDDLLDQSIKILDENGWTVKRVNPDKPSIPLRTKLLVYPKTTAATDQEEAGKSPPTPPKTKKSFPFAGWFGNRKLPGRGF